MYSDEYYRMAEMEHTHWWYKSLHNLVLSYIEKHFDSTEINIIDAGCGTGGLITFLKNKGYHNVQGFDLSEVALQICSEREIFAFKGDLKEISTHYGHNYADVIISNDTFYFLNMNEQKKLTDEIYPLLRENGLLIANMPSLEAFRGIHDLQVGIKKRFGRKDIWKIFDRDKYSLVTKMYWPFILSPVIWLSRFIQRMKMRFNSHIAIGSDLRKEGRIVNSLLFSVTKAENHFPMLKPFGSSLFLVMKKITLNS